MLAALAYWKYGVMALLAIAALGLYAMLERSWRAEETARRNYEIEKKANEVNTQTIRDLNEWRDQNSALAMELAGQLEAERKKEDDTRTDIGELAGKDKSVADYLRTPIPEPLRLRLNRDR